MFHFQAWPTLPQNLISTPADIYYILGQAKNVESTEFSKISKKSVKFRKFLVNDLSVVKGRKRRIHGILQNFRFSGLFFLKSSKTSKMYVDQMLAKRFRFVRCLKPKTWNYQFWSIKYRPNSAFSVYLWPKTKTVFFRDSKIQKKILTKFSPKIEFSAELSVFRFIRGRKREIFRFGGVILKIQKIAFWSDFGHIRKYCRYPWVSRFWPVFHTWPLRPLIEEVSYHFWPCEIVGSQEVELGRWPQLASSAANTPQTFTTVGFHIRWTWRRGLYEYVGVLEAGL